MKEWTRPVIKKMDVEETAFGDGTVFDSQDPS